MMYGQKSAMALPMSGAGMMLESVWMVFAAITVVFMGISAYQLVRPAGNHPRP
jgi:heme/copper-type cytochrome/quinol oxidase subunit 2